MIRHFRLCVAAIALVGFVPLMKRAVAEKGGAQIAAD